MRTASNNPPDKSRRRRRLQFTLRGLLVVILLISGVLAMHANSARRRGAAVERLLRMHCTVVYDFEELDKTKFLVGKKRRAALKGPKWLREGLGVDYFHDAVAVYLLREDIEAAIPHLKNLPRLREVSVLEFGGCIHGRDFDAAQQSLFKLRRELPRVQITHTAIAIVG